MPAPRRVAVMLGIDFALKRHVDMLAGTQQYAVEHGWYSIIDEYADATLPARPNGSLPYDGIIARATTKLALRAARLGVPVVNVWVASPVWKVLPNVFPDHAAIGRLHAEHLLSRGFIRFACLRTDRGRAQQIEVDAFTRTIAAAGFPCLEAAVHHDGPQSLSNWRGTQRTIASWMARWEPSIGVYVVGHDAYARLVVQACHNRGWRVPADVAVTGGQNEEVYCEHLRPTLTSVEAGFTRIGYEAARLLDRLMDGQPPPPGPTLLQPRGLVVRESTDFFAVDDELIAAALAFIAANCHKPIAPAHVARAVFTELRTLQRRFRASLARPIATEIRRVRIERAKRLLTETKKSMAEIARDVGFGRAIRLSEIFRREVGTTPGDYRRQRAPSQGKRSRLS